MNFDLRTASQAMEEGIRSAQESRQKVNYSLLAWQIEYKMQQLARKEQALAEREKESEVARIQGRYNLAQKEIEAELKRKEFSLKERELIAKEKEAGENKTEEERLRKTTVTRERKDEKTGKIEYLNAYGDVVKSGSITPKEDKSGRVAGEDLTLGKYIDESPILDDLKTRHKEILKRGETLRKLITKDKQSIKEEGFKNKDEILTELESISADSLASIELMDQYQSKLKSSFEVDYGRSYPKLPQAVPRTYTVGVEELTVDQIRSKYPQLNARYSSDDDLIDAIERKLNE